ncbi:hypothetical protein GQ651_01310 [Alphaproteobacteria bacterium GH1-50]|uniref:Uncharacterized protein n=1 Tax=Kangsaoukella pontilimi TaxID=2691042 RepID=A0A7C9MDH6_9RHOB|nr:hypothetical protein [Kangsaoukella pontilimi]MXQ06476.1 hypothetical protein [Kangsaoukella pontilimi]
MSLFRKPGARRRGAGNFYQLWITDFGPDKTAVARVIAGEWDSETDEGFMAVLDRTPWLYQSLDAGPDTFSLLNILAHPLENAGARTEITAADSPDTPYRGS